MMNEEPVKILLIEDELLIAKDIEASLAEKGYQVTGIAQNREKALSLFKLNEPDLIICDVNLKENTDGIDMARELLSIRPVRILFLTAYSDPSYIEKATALNPKGYITKPFNDKQLLTSVSMALQDYDKESVNRLEQLSGREREITRSIIEGMSNKEIGEKLFISEMTVKTHRKIIKKKLAIQNPSDWYRYKDYLV